MSLEGDEKGAVSEQKDSDEGKERQGSIKASFVFNDQTYHGAYIRHIRHRLKFWVYLRALLCIGFITAGGVLIAISLGDDNRTLAGIGTFSVVAGSFGFMRPIIWQVWHERQARHNPCYNTRLHYGFAEDVLSVKGNQGNYDLEWEKNYELVVTKKGVLIYMTKKSYLWVPKAALKSVEEMQKVEKIVQFAPTILKLRP